MKNAVLLGFVVLLCATPSAAQFQNTDLDPFATPYPSPPYFLNGGRVVSVTFATSSNVVDALVPEPLIPLAPQITVVINDFPFYTEAALEIPVSYQGVDGSYFPILYVDTLLGIITGREIWGFPKLDANIDIVWSPGDDFVTATVSMADTDLITITADFGTQRASPQPEALVELYNLKLIPSAEEGGEPDVCQITRLLASLTASDVRTGTGTLSFGRLPTDPLADIPIDGLVDVTTYSRDITLPYGQVVFDYLSQPGGCPFRFTEAFVFTDSFESGDTSAWSATVP